MNILGLYITTTKRYNEMVDLHVDECVDHEKTKIQRKKESSLWDKVVGKLLRENFNLRKAAR